MIQPRPYQEEAHTALWEFLHNPDNYRKNPLIVEATGLGKSLNIAMFIWHMLAEYPNVRIMQLTHVKELIDSNVKELLALWPEAPVGVYSAGLNQRDTYAQVTFAGIQSVYKIPEAFGVVDFVIVDEAHLISPNSETMYGTFLDALRKKNPHLVVIGYTATPFRLKSGMLTDPGGMFDEIVYDIGSGESFNKAIEDGYLIRPVPTATDIKVNDANIGISGGEFKNSDASAALEEQNILERAVAYTVKTAFQEQRQRALIFAQSIEHAELLAQMFTDNGYPTKAVHSKRSDRDEVLAAHRRGDLWGVTNQGVLTTGYNDPAIDLLVALRLTRSPGLWVQMVGRCTRPVWLPGYDISTKEGRLASIAASHKQDARVLDFVGNTERLGPINYPNVPKRRGKGGGPAPVRVCPQCQPNTFHHTSVQVCPLCGYVWPKQVKLRPKASDAELVAASKPEKPKHDDKVFPVNSVTIVRHAGRNGKLDTLCATYRCGRQMFKEWLGFEHQPRTYPRIKAERWWMQHTDNSFPIPADVEEAVSRANEVHAPKSIKVRFTPKKYPQVIGYDFEGHKFVVDTDPNALQNKKRAALQFNVATGLNLG